MNRFFKTSAILFLLLLLAICAAAAALWYFVPREQVKELITRELSSRLSQTITMSSFSLGLYPDLEFTARNMRIIDPASSREIAAAEKIRFDLDMWQLFNRRFVVEAVTAGSPRINIFRTAAGTWNIMDIVHNARAATPVADKAQPETGLQFRDIKIRNGSISVSDALQGQYINLENLAGTINLKQATVTIDSASLAMPALTAEFSGSIARLFTADPRPDISAKVQLRKEGPLAGIISETLPAGSTLADVTLNASGSIKALVIKTSFSIDPRATAGLPAQGTASGTLQTEEGVGTIDSLDLRCGKSTLVLSGSVDNLWQQEREARLQGTSSLWLDETVPLAGSDALATLDLHGTADARVSLSASSGGASLSADVDLNQASFVLPSLILKEAGSPAVMLLDAQFASPDELIINNIELKIGENLVTGTVKLDPGAEPRMQTSLHTSPLPLTLFNLLQAVQGEGGVMTLSAQAWHSGEAQDELQYKAQAFIQDGTLTTQIMKDPFDQICASIEAVNNLASIPEATFFLADMPCQLQAEVADFSNPRITGQLYTNALDIDRLITAFGKREKPDSAEPPDTSPHFSLDMAVDTSNLCFGKLRTGAVSTIWHTSGGLQQFEPLQAELFGGTLNGALHLSFHKGDNRWYVTFSGEEMEIESLCDQFFSGKTAASAKGRFRSEGNLHGISSREKDEVWQSMQGNIKLSVAEGEIRQSALFNSVLLALRFTQGIVPVPGIRDLNLVNIFRDIAKTITRTLDVSRMAFKKIEGAFKITDGVARTEDLYFEGEDADFAFKGSFDLVRNEMDITINVIPTGTIDSLVEKIPFVGKQVGRVKKATLSFDLVARGPFANPDVTLQAVDKILPD